MITSSFKSDLMYISSLLKKRIPFCITRFGDGEYMVMEGKKIFLSNSKKEFDFSGESHLQSTLINSFKHKQNNYFVGIPCPCCQPKEICNRMKKLSEQSEEKLTWANIFVNSNYNVFKSIIVPLFNKYTTTFVGQGNINNLKIKIDNSHLIGPNAWVNNVDVYDKIRKQILDNNSNKELFLFAAGPFANILCYKLYKEFPENTFLNIGSVFNVDLGHGPNRGYLKGSENLNKVCKW